jgi:transcriptional regulator with XRE-family HTH domain
MDPKLFGARLKELREQAGLTQKALADKAGISQRAVSHYEQGLHDPTWTSVLALATALGVDCLAFQQPPAEVPEPRRGRPRKAAGEVSSAAPPPEPPKRGRRKGGEGAAG